MIHDLISLLDNERGALGLYLSYILEIPRNFDDLCLQAPEHLAFTSFLSSYEHVFISLGAADLLKEIETAALGVLRSEDRRFSWPSMQPLLLLRKYLPFAAGRLWLQRLFMIALCGCASQLPNGVNPDPEITLEEEEILTAACSALRDYSDDFQIYLFAHILSHMAESQRISLLLRLPLYVQQLDKQVPALSLKSFQQLLSALLHLHHLHSDKPSAQERVAACLQHYQQLNLPHDKHQILQNALAEISKASHHD